MYVSKGRRTTKFITAAAAEMLPNKGEGGGGEASYSRFDVSPIPIHVRGIRQFLPFVFGLR